MKSTIIFITFSVFLVGTKGKKSNILSNHAFVTVPSSSKVEEIWSVSQHFRKTSIFPSSTSSSSSSSFQSFSSNEMGEYKNSDENEEFGEMRLGELFKNQQKLEDSIGDLFRKGAPITKSSDYYERAIQNEKQMRAIQDMAPDYSYTNNVDLFDNNQQMNFYTDEDDLNDVYLDADTYASYSRSMPFTSLSPKMIDFDNQSELDPFNPREFDMSTSSFYSAAMYSGQDRTYSTQNNITNLTAAVDEELHRQIFANEQDFINQDKDFVKKLFAGENSNDDGGDINNTLKKRRASRYNERQQNAMKMIEQQLEDVNIMLQRKKENVLSTDNATTTAGDSPNITNIGKDVQGKCQKCGCVLTIEEIEHSQICHICHSEKFQFMSGVAVTKGYSEPGNENFQRRDRYEWDNRRKMQNPQKRTLLHRNRTGYQQPEQPRDRRSIPVKKTSTSLEQDQAEIIFELKSDVEKYKSLYEETATEMKKLQHLVTKLNNEMDTLRKNKGDTDRMDSHDNTNKEIILNKANMPSTTRRATGKIDRSIWLENVDKKTGNIYLWNKKTGETKWESEF